MKKRFLSMTLAVLMVFSLLSTSAFAADRGTAYELTPEVLEPVTAAADNTESELQHIDVSEIQLDLDDAPLADLTSLSNRRSAVSVTQHIPGILETQGSAQYAIFALSQNQVAQLTLHSPDNANLDYDLMLYKINSEGYTEGPIESSSLSTYINTNGHTLDESITYIRTEAGTQQYAIFVYARVGGSTNETFTLTISLDLAANLDQYEPNDSPYSPTSFTMNTAGIFSGVNLNVINDQDWFLWRNEDGFDKLSISATEGHQVEVYHVQNGSQMVLNPYTLQDGVRVFDAAGLNYIRIFSEKNESDFSYANYTVSLHPYRSAAMANTIKVTLDGDQGQNSYVTYYGTTLFRYKDVLSPIVQVLDISGRPIEGVSVTMTLVSSFWSESSGNQVQTYYSPPTDENGRAVFNVHPPATTGTFAVLLQDAITFRHHVDIDALTFSVGGVSTSEQVYRLAYSEYVG